MRRWYVYILMSRGGTLYTGVTNDLVRRLAEHRSGLGSDFTARYNVTQLVCCADFDSPRAAIEAEKRIKGWRRDKKPELIREANPTFRDLSDADQ